MPSIAAMTAVEADETRKPSARRCRPVCVGWNCRCFHQHSALGEQRAELHLVERQNACGEGCDERGEDGEGVIEVTEATEYNERAMGYWFVPPCSRQRGSQEQ